jgi:hypothetical protein
MSTSQRTFEQVKSILGKLDRDIDAARQKRLQARMPQPAAAGPAIPAARPLATPGTSGFGRATPMRMEHRTQPRQ